MIRQERPRLLLGLVVLVALGVFVATQLRVTTDITHFVPDGADDPDLLLAQQVAVGELSRTMVMLVETGGPDRAAAISREFEAALRADPAVMHALVALEGAPADDFEAALYQLWQPRRFGLAADGADAARALVSDAGLDRAVDELQRKLASPMSSLVTRLAPEDPFLIVPQRLERLAGRGDGLGLVDGRFVTTDGKAAVFFVTTHASASDSTVQRPLLARLRSCFAAVAARHQPPPTLHLSGTNRHAIAAEDDIRADIERVSIGSTIALLLTFLLLFSSLRLPLSWLPVLAAGFVAGAATCILLFGEVHGMTIAFGSSLIGVSIDYAVHFYCHQAMAPAAAGPRATMVRLWPGLRLGCATTVVGFVVLLVATFPGLREMAAFAAVGLTASLVAAWAFLPGLVGPIAPTRVSTAVVRCMQWLTHFRGRARWLYVLPLGAVIVLIAVGLPRAEWSDNLQSLTRRDPALVAEDDMVVQRVTRLQQRRMIVALGDDEQQALVVNDRVAAALAAAEAKGELQGFRSAAAVLPSAARQLEVDAVMRADPTLWPRLQQRLSAEGFVAERFTPFRDALLAPAPPPLVAADLLATPLASLVRPFRLPLADGRFVLLSYLAVVNDEAALRARLATIPGARMLDVEATITAAFATYRGRMTTLLLLGLLAVLALVVWRYRRWQPIALAVVPALLGAAGTVALLALCGVAMTMLSLVSLLMVVSMGVDYGIFLAEDERYPAARGATQLGVLVDGLTTILGFGLLALSDQPSLFGIGATAGIGVTACLVLALAFGALVANKERPA